MVFVKIEKREIINSIETLLWKLLYLVIFDEIKETNILILP